MSPLDFFGDETILALDTANAEKKDGGKGLGIISSNFDRCIKEAAQG